MHGIIVTELKNFVVEKYGEDAWRELAEVSGFDSPMVLPIRMYDDEKVDALIENASAATELSPEEIQRAFGAYIAPKLLEMYESQIEDEWGPVDIIENAEQQIHSLVREDNPKSDPPELAAKRKSEERVIVNYSSSMEMCDVAKGIVDGIAAEHEKTAAVTERSCIHGGADVCTLDITIE